MNHLYKMPGFRCLNSTTINGQYLQVRCHLRCNARRLRISPKISFQIFQAQIPNASKVSQGSNFYKVTMISKFRVKTRVEWFVIDALLHSLKSQIQLKTTIIRDLRLDLTIWYKMRNKVCNNSSKQRYFPNKLK